MVEVKPPKPALEKLNEGRWEVYRVASESEPGVYHVVAVRYQFQGGIPLDLHDCYFAPVEWICSCKGFNYNRTCWHLYELGYMSE